MTYQLFIGEDCHQCQEVTDYIEHQNIDCEVINIDQSAKRPPVIVFAFPALFEGEKLLAYGTDIVEHLKRK